MNGNGYVALLIAIMALVTWLLRFAPFLIFRKRVPAYIVYLGNVLPPAIIGMLVIYCLKDVSLTAAPFGLPELIAGGSVVALQCWKKNSLISILCGTVLYMLLIQLVF